MNWGALVTALLTFFGKVFDVFREKQLRQVGADAQVLVDQKEAVHAVQVANDARAAVERAAVLDPAGVLNDDDGFKRPN